MKIQVLPLFGRLCPPHKFVLSNKNYIPATLKMSRIVKVVKMTHDPALDIDQDRKISDSIFTFVRTSKKTKKITFHHFKLWLTGSNNLFRNYES